jgi:hypothetical protein
MFSVTISRVSASSYANLKPIHFVGIIKPSLVVKGLPYELCLCNTQYITICSEGKSAFDIDLRIHYIGILGNRGSAVQKIISP